MSKKSIELPECIADASSAQDLAALYRGEGASPRQRLALLEQQALFFLLVEALETPDANFTELLLCPPDDPEDTIWINLKDADGQEWDIVDESEDMGAAAIALMNSLPYLHADHTFVQSMADQPLTRENKWSVASHIFGEQVASTLQAADLDRSSPKKDAHGPARPRM